MRETLEGRGQLEAWVNPVQKHEVDYHFEITTDIVERPGFPKVAARKHAHGTVISTVGKSFAEGEYRLFAQDGEILKVKNLGLAWTILAS